MVHPQRMANTAANIREYRLERRSYKITGVVRQSVAQRVEADFIIPRI